MTVGASNPALLSLCWKKLEPLPITKAAASLCASIASHFVDIEPDHTDHLRKVLADVSMC